VGKRWLRCNSAARFSGLGCLASLLWMGRGQVGFTERMEWADRGRLSKTDPLPLIANLELGGRLNGSQAVSLSASRGSFLADFGILDLPGVGEVRARAGMRYSSLYPRGALELACRKERFDDDRGNEIFAGFQSTSDDSRLDMLLEAGAVKRFRNAKLFYRFNAGCGGEYKGKWWGDAGSSIGVIQQELPPGRAGELTVGWRTRLLDGGDPHVLRFHERSHSQNADLPHKRSLADFPLQSTPFAAYSLKLPGQKGRRAFLETAAYPQHDVVHHSAKLQVPAEEGELTYSATLEHSISDPKRLRVRTGVSFTSTV